MSDEIVAAFIGAGSALATIVIKDIFFDSIKEYFLNNRNTRKMYLIYTAPIIKASESLCWRLKEVFDNRGTFLLTDKKTNDFYEYKYISTIYRLAALLGWIKALEREFSIINTTNKNENIKIVESINGFKSSLADGNYVELSVLKDITSLFHIDLSGISDKKKAILAVHLEDALYTFLIKKRVDSAQELLKKDQVRLVGILKKQIIFESKCKSQVNVKFSSLDNDKAIRILSRTIAWLYRDWQSAIGSEMIKESANGIRHYEVIDFGEFESLYNTKKNVWIKRLEKLFINLNVDSKEYSGLKI